MPPNPLLYAPTELAPIQQLIHGIPKRTLTGIFGPPEGGKTTIAAQLAVEYALEADGNAAILNTELDPHSLYYLIDGLSKRYGEPLNFVPVLVDVVNSGTKSKPKFEAKWDYEVDPDKSKTNVFVIDCPDIEPITHLMGRGATVDISEGGKVSIDLVDGGWSDRIQGAPIYKFCEQHNIQSLVIDSVTNPLDEIPAKNKNFPGRTDLTQVWLVQTMKLAWARKIPVFAIMHETKNDTDPFNKALSMEGGKGITYNVKHVLYCFAKNERGLLSGKDAPKPEPIADTGRYVFAARCPGKKSWSEYKILDITDQGFVPYKQ